MAQCELDGARAYVQRLDTDETERSTLCRDLMINVTEFSVTPRSLHSWPTRFCLICCVVEMPVTSCGSGRRAAPVVRRPTRWPCWRLMLQGAWASMAMSRCLPPTWRVTCWPRRRAEAIAMRRWRQSPRAAAAVFLRESEEGVRVDSNLRRHVVFARHNLLSDPPFTRIDLAVCRNLLIYLKPVAQIKALSQLHFALKPHGVLLLGPAKPWALSSRRRFHRWTVRTSCFASSPWYWPGHRCAHDGRQGRARATEMALPDVAGQPPEVLEAELLATRERLQEMVLELQASHERLDLGNEELTASNEELQSTNEELKSVNEDLYVLNRELEDKNDELAALNRDYDHLLDSTEIGIVFLDAQLHLRRFSPAVGEFLALRSSDLGRPVREIHYRIGSQKQFLEELQRCARRASASNMKWPWTPGAGCTSACRRSRKGGPGRRCGAHMDRHQRSQAHADADRATGGRPHPPDGHPRSAARRRVYRQPEIRNRIPQPALEREFGPVAGRQVPRILHGRNSQCDWCTNDKVLRAKRCIGNGPRPRGAPSTCSTCLSTTRMARSAV